MFSTIRAKFSLIFIIFAVAIAITAITNATQSQNQLEQIHELSRQFNPAISSIINGDRDLYQAHLSEVILLDGALTAQQRDDQISNWQENADQAKQRVADFSSHLDNYPEILNALNGFNTQYQKWFTASTSVIDAVKVGDYATAKQRYKDTSLIEFARLRDIFNAAGERADEQVKLIDLNNTQTSKKHMTILFTVSGILIVLIIFLAYYGPKIVVDRIKDVTDRITDIGKGDGDLTRRLIIKQHDEIGELAAAFNHFVDHLQQMIIAIDKQSNDVNSCIEQLASNAGVASQISQEQHYSVDSIVTAVNQMSSAVREVAKNALDTASEINNVNDQTVEGKRILSLSVDNIQQLAASVQNAVVAIQALSTNSSQIASVLDVIRGIAEQTNLLALNAAIEAARAGEQGRGFAVVADEVRTLASRTERSIQDIQSMIEKLQAGVKDAVHTIEAGASLTATTVELSSQTQTSLDLILQATAKVSDMSTHTAAATEQQTHVTEEINRNLTELSDKTRHCNDVIAENQQIAKKTASVCKSLRSEVVRFKVV
ncbi:methyl-accepting chemotaxis protein [Shewanella frigidimarina]|uniref:methyl-accepting chemotaxis protein n=1 Tax=Shewanella frigidimarina TaxID=56812 RepID=UPI003FA0FD33